MSFESARGRESSDVETSSGLAFPIRPVRRDGESDLGYQLRVADANGVNSPVWLLRRSGSRGFGRVRVCRACLAVSKPYWHVDWVDEHRPWCTKHHAWLSDQCGRCRGVLRWNRVALSRCLQCGASLASPDRPEVAVELALIEANDPAILIWFGALAEYGFRGKPLKQAEARSVSCVRQLLIRGAEVVAGWPVLFLGVLAEAHARAGSGPMRINAAFPRLHAIVRRLPSEQWRRQVFAAVEAYVQSTHSTGSPLVGRNPGIDVGTTSVTALSKQFGAVSYTHLTLPTKRIV